MVHPLDRRTNDSGRIRQWNCTAAINQIWRLTQQ